MSGPLVIAIDGPAGSGKSAVAAKVARRLGLPHVDSGSMYRAVTLACLRAGVDPDDEAACARVARESTLEVDGECIRLDGEDVTRALRADDVTDEVSAVSAHPAVRASVTPTIRRELRGGGVADGRDIGTVVAPDADLKVFLTADVLERAKRRAEQDGRGDLDSVVAEIRRRDGLDTGRSNAPLAAAADARLLDTSTMDLDEVVDRIVGWVEALTAVRVDPVAARAALPRVVVLGRPNVGKSTLVNRILGRRVAIVEERPGVTRDRTEHPAQWLGRPFVLVDTGGWEQSATGIGEAVVAQAEAALAAADLVLFVVDVTVGALDDDERFARVVRRSGVPALLVANKADSPRREADAHALHTLGLGAPVAVSARHGRGVGDLLDEALALLPPAPDQLADADDVPRVAIVGKPNVGKSSLFNRLLGQERAIVDAVPHTTRDAVDTLVEVDGEPWVFVDTAGMRRRYRHGEDAELYSVDRTRDAIAAADLVLFVLDASEPIGEQDQRLAALVRDAGRGVVVACTKWDLVDDDRRAELERELDRLLGFLRFAPRVNVSATTGRGTRRIVPTLRDVWRQYTRRVGSGELNRWLERVTDRTPPPTKGGRSTRVRYVTQAETRPPVFVAFGSSALPAAYRRYLERELRAEYGFTGVPLAIRTRGR